MSGLDPLLTILVYAVNGWFFGYGVVAFYNDVVRPLRAVPE